MESRVRHPKKNLYTASPSSVRHVNRSIVLSLIRTHEPVSRVALSEMTGMFRSNVSEIVDQLIEDGLVREERAVPVGRGRVPYNLSLNDDSLLVVGISIRQSTTTLALAGISGRIQETVTFETLADPVRQIREIRKAMLRLKRSAGKDSAQSIRECGVSFPGHVPAESGVISWAPSLPSYTGFAFAEEMHRRLGVVTSCENDCNLGALAEMWLCEEDIAGLNDFIFLEVGEVGLGGGIIINRELYRGHDADFIAEFGHMSLDPDGPLCPCGRSGCWELFVCDRTTWRRYDPGTPFTAARFQRLLKAGPEEGGRPALLETARFLSFGLANIALAFNPEVVVLAGRITNAWDLIRHTVETAHGSANLKIRVRPARLDAEQLFLHGAVHLALTRVFAKPRLGW
jgi:predicted NBD/HSP70 family sugar kinase